jgi:hypothetical protein
VCKFVCTVQVYVSSGARIENVQGGIFEAPLAMYACTRIELKWITYLIILIITHLRKNLYLI